MKTKKTVGQYFVVEPIAVVEVERNGRWGFMANVYPQNTLEKMPVTHEVVLAAQLGDVTGVRVRYLQGEKQ